MSYKFEILTPGKKLIDTEVSEVIFHAYDGERGVLPKHENYIGRLGTGALKLVREKQDYWYMVSGGVYQVKNTALTLFAVQAESIEDIDKEKTQKAIDSFNQDSLDVAERAEYERNLARLDVYNRSKVVN